MPFRVVPLILKQLDRHLLDGLAYQEVVVFGGYISRQRAERQVEKRAWEIYGGPSGLEARQKQ